jgi:phosphate/sulfate permease/outer membrane protein OmpA-like peptidoglycan-associated protein
VQEIGLSLIVSPLFGLTLAGLLLLFARKVLASRVLHDPADPQKTPPWWVRLLLIGTCSGVSFAHGSNDGQKGVGLVMLILIGILPADFALNTRYAASDIDKAVAVADDMARATRLAYADAEPAKLAANAPLAPEESTAAKVVMDLASIHQALAGKTSLREVPAAERWDLRTKVLRVDANLSTLEKTQPKALNKEQTEAMKKHRVALRGLVDYAPSWVLVCIALALGVGTMVGWKRIVVTVGEKIGKTHMSYSQGAAAELVAASTIGVSAYLGLPVSTTHVLSSGIAGTMLAQRSGLQKSTVRNIALAWLLTLPASIILAGVLFVCFRAVIPNSLRSPLARIDSAAISASDPEATPLPVVASKDVVRLHGSNTLGATLAPELVEAFLAKKNGRNVQRNAGRGSVPGWTVSSDVAGRPVVFEIDAAGTATAFEDLASGKCDIGLASRRVTQDEATKLRNAGVGDVTSAESEHVVGLDGIAVIVNRRNPIDAFTLTELAAIYTGEQKAWRGDASSLGSIEVVSRDEHSGTFDSFKNLVGHSRPLVATKRFSDNGLLSDEVANNSNAIGFVPMNAIGEAKAVALGEDAQAAAVPSPFNVATESYALARRVYLYTTNATSNPLAKELVAFALSEEGQRVVAAAGFVDLGVKRRAAAPCTAGCPVRYANLTKNASRLSIDFRFRHGSAELDTRGHEDLGRLSAYVKEHPESKVALIGFADNVGDNDVNLEVSRVRARAVDAELRARGLSASLVDGFGEALPVASNSTPTGREHNRRVEVWLLPH